jgi:hypothetical protein
MDDKHSANGWTRIGKIRSESNPAKEYVIAIRTTGYLGCDCPSMKFRKGVKPHGEFEATCKHIRAVIDGTVSLADWNPTPFGTAWYQQRLGDLLTTGGVNPTFFAKRLADLVAARKAA